MSFTARFFDGNIIYMIQGVRKCRMLSFICRNTQTNTNMGKIIYYVNYEMIMNDMTFFNN